MWLDEHPIPDMFATLPFDLPALLFHDPAAGAGALTGGADFSNPEALVEFYIRNARQLGTAGKLLFGGDISGNFIAFDPANGKPLWHSQIGQVTNAPETYMVDGRQHILVAAGDTLYSFSLYQ